MTFKPQGAVAVLLACAASLASSACTTIQDALDPSNIDYRSANRGPGLDVPPDLVGPKADDRYVVPDRGTGKTYSGYASERKAAADVDSRRGAGADVLPVREGARIERDGRLRWLVVDRRPEQVWPLLVEFWKSEGFELPVDSPATGMLETDWSKRREKAESSGIRGLLSAGLGTAYSTAVQDRFRTRVEPGPDGGTEIVVSHQAMEEVVDSKLADSTIWQPAPSRPELELEFMRRLMLRLGTPQAEVQREVARAEAPRPARASIVPVAGGVDAITIREGFDRAWRELGLVIDRIGFTVEDRDRSRGTYFVRYVDLDRRDPRQGTMSRLFSGERKDLSGQRYQIVVTGEGAGSRVTVRGDEGKPLERDEDRRVANRIIALLHERLR
ncbi:MAG: outer membrane protein assembly factor BamC [Lautropia sp.]